MQDFTKLAESQKQNRALKIQNSATEQTGFIASRLNKDNFWNLVFAFLLFLAWAAGFTIPQPIGGIIFWLTFSCAILLIKHTSYLTFDKEKLEFTTSQGDKIQKSGLAFFWLLFASALLAGGVVSIFPTANIKTSLLSQILFTFLFGIFPSLYCILRNFPIAVYFHKNAWYVEGTNTASSNSDHSKRHESLLSTNQLINNPINNWYSGNIFHKK